MLKLPFPVKVETASSAVQALEQLKNMTPDLILSDIRMPVMDGFEMIEKIQSAGFSGDIVILTSHADFEYARTAIRYGVIDFLLKPINQEALQKIILKSCEQKQEKAREAANTSLRHVLSMTLYGIPASDLLLSEEVLRTLFPFQYFTVIVVETQAENPDAISVEKLLRQYYRQCHCFFLAEKGEIVAICNHEKYHVKPAMLDDSLRQILISDFLTGVSISSTSIHKLYQLYKNARQRIFYRKTFGSNTQLVETASLSYHNCVSIFLEPDEQLAAEKIRSMINNHLLVDRPQSAYLNQILISFLHNIALYLRENGFQISIDPDTEQAPGTIEALTQTIFSKLIGIKALLKSQTAETDHNIQISQILNYINAHSHIDISLNDLSAAVGLNPHYICTLLKKHTGTNYLTWLHKERIRVAKNLLKKDSLTIEQIATTVGYNSSTQLARVFRRYERLSPSEYRDSL